jgi:quercetin dioxygenase-like cupin family protein
MHPSPVAIVPISKAPTETYGGATIHWLASRRASAARELTVGRTVIGPGAGSPMHRHPNCEEVLHMLRGEIDQIVEGQPPLRMRAGDTVTIARDIRHCAINVGKEEAEMMVIFSAPERVTIIEAAGGGDGERRVS